MYDEFVESRVATNAFVEYKFKITLPYGICCYSALLKVLLFNPLNILMNLLFQVCIFNDSGHPAGRQSR